MSISQDEEERVRMMWEEKNALDLQDYIVTAKREGQEESDKKWQGIVAEKDAVISEQDALIEELRKRLGESEQ